MARNERTVAFKKAARNVFFHLLTRCNLRCSHCYINPEEHGTQTLPAETVKAWLRDLVDEEGESNLILIGGEPTLHPSLPDLIRAARRIGYRSVTVDTNGFFFNRILDQVRPEEVDYFSVGLDGSCADVNDRIRGKGSFEKAVAGVREALEKGFRLSVIYTVSRLNLEDVKNMPVLLGNLGIDRLFIQVIGIRGRSAEAQGKALQLTRDQWTRVVPEAAARAVRSGIAVTYPKVFLRPGEGFECAGLVAQNYFVFPNGRVYRCPLCEDFALHAYEIGEHGLVPTPSINEENLFELSIPEGCVMNRLVQPGNLEYDAPNRPKYQIGCCLLKEELVPEKPQCRSEA